MLIKLRKILEIFIPRKPIPVPVRKAEDVETDPYLASLLEEKALWEVNQQMRKNR